MQPQGEGRDLRGQLREVLREASRLSALIQRAESPARHTKPDRPQLRLIRGGKALVLAPVTWAWTQVRDHAAAAVPLAATGVIGTAATLGVAAPPEIHPGPEPTSVTRFEEPAGFGSYVYRQAPTPTPTPTPTAAVEVVESEAIPALPAPTSAPLLPAVPLPTETPVPEAVEPAEGPVWSTATAVVHCREVLLAVDLHGCVRGLLAG